MVRAYGANIAVLLALGLLACSIDAVLLPLAPVVWSCRCVWGTTCRTWCLLRHHDHACSAFVRRQWPFESAKTISAAINVLNDYTDTVKTLDRGKLWHMLWQYTAIHTPLWKVINDTDGTSVDIAERCGDTGKDGTATKTV